MMRIALGLCFLICIRLSHAMPVHNVTRLEVNFTEGIAITSPNYENGSYPHLTEMFWELHASHAKKIHVVFEDFDIEFHHNCVWDSVSLVRSKCEYFTTFPRGDVVLCGSLPVDTFDSDSSPVCIMFTSDRYVNKRGFKAHVVAIPVVDSSENKTSFSTTTSRAPTSTSSTNAISSSTRPSQHSTLSSSSTLDNLSHTSSSLTSSLPPPSSSLSSSSSVSSLSSATEAASSSSFSASSLLSSLIKTTTTSSTKLTTSPVLVTSSQPSSSSSLSLLSSSSLPLSSTTTETSTSLPTVSSSISISTSISPTTSSTSPSSTSLLTVSSFPTLSSPPVSIVEATSSSPSTSSTPASTTAMSTLSVDVVICEPNPGNIDIEELHEIVVMSPTDETGRYPLNKHCALTINNHYLKDVDMKFIRFEIENHLQCKWDYLELKVGNASSRRLCGMSAQNPPSTQAEKIELLFHSDYIVSLRGFEMKFIIKPHSTEASKSTDEGSSSTITTVKETDDSESKTTLSGLSSSSSSLKTTTATPVITTTHSLATPSTKSLTTATVYTTLIYKLQSSQSSKTSSQSGKVTTPPAETVNNKETTTTVSKSSQSPTTTLHNTKYSSTTLSSDKPFSSTLQLSSLSSLLSSITTLTSSVNTELSTTSETYASSSTTSSSVTPSTKSTITTTSVVTSLDVSICDYSASSMDITYLHEILVRSQKEGKDTYLVNEHCVLIIDNHQHLDINIEFLKFDVEYHPTCFWDYVTLKLEGAPLDPMCGNLSPNIQSTNANRIEIIFHSDSIVPATGFEIKLTILSNTLTSKSNLLNDTTDSTEAVISTNEGSPSTIATVKGTDESVLTTTFSDSSSSSSLATTIVTPVITTTNSQATTSYLTSSTKSLTTASVYTTLVSKLQSSLSSKASSQSWTVTTPPAETVDNKETTTSVSKSSQSPSTTLHNTKYSSTTLSSDKRFSSTSQLSSLSSLLSSIASLTSVNAELSTTSETYASSSTTSPSVTPSTKSTITTSLVKSLDVNICDNSASSIDITYLHEITVRSQEKGAYTYPVNEHCVLVIDNHQHLDIDIEFLKFDVEYHPTCSWDYVMLKFEGAPLHPLCGNLSPDIQSTNANRIEIVFHSDYIVPSTGFEIKLTIQSDSGRTLVQNTSSPSTEMSASSVKQSTLSVTASTENSNTTSKSSLSSVTPSSTDSYTTSKLFSLLSESAIKTSTTSTIPKSSSTSSLNKGMTSFQTTTKEAGQSIKTGSVQITETSTPELSFTVTEKHSSNELISTNATTKSSNKTYEPPTTLSSATKGVSVLPTSASTANETTLDVNICNFTQSDIDFGQFYEIFIRSPRDETGRYPLHENCDLIIINSQHLDIKIEFIEFDIENHPQCSFDYLMLTIGDETSFRLCGGKMPEPFSLKAYKTEVVFYSDYIIPANGFVMRLTKYGESVEGETQSQEYPSTISDAAQKSSASTFVTPSTSVVTASTNVSTQKTPLSTSAIDVSTTGLTTVSSGSQMEQEQDFATPGNSGSTSFTTGEHSAESDEPSVQDQTFKTSTEIYKTESGNVSSSTTPLKESTMQSSLEDTYPASTYSAVADSITTTQEYTSKQITDSAASSISSNTTSHGAKSSSTTKSSTDSLKETEMPSSLKSTDQNADYLSTPESEPALFSSPSQTNTPLTKPQSSTPISTTVSSAASTQTGALITGHTASPESACLDGMMPQVMNQEFGYITSPGFGHRDGYPPGSTCQWIVKGDENKVTVIIFEYFDVEGSTGCIFDKLVFHETSSNGETKEVLANLCGDNIPSTLSTRKSLLIEFKSDSVEQRTGFRLQFIKIQSDSGMTYSCPPGKIPCLTNGTCIPVEWWCDGSVDCGTDEINCPRCRDDQMQCAGGVCLSLSKRCDGIPQCSYGTDERDCVSVPQENIEEAVQVNVKGAWFPLCHDEVTQQLPGDICKAAGYRSTEFFTGEKVQHQQLFSVARPESGRLTFYTSSTCQGQRVVHLQCSDSDCGKKGEHYRKKRIIGGTKSSKGEWPWSVGIRTGNTVVCGGSIIDNTWIVTAGHCVKDLVDNPQILSIVAGVTDINDAGVQTRYVSEVIVHPDYHFIFNADIALLRLHQPLEFDSNTKPICLPWDKRQFSPSDLCFVTGFGVSDMQYYYTTVAPKFLRHIKTKIFDLDRCKEIYSTRFSESDRIKDNMLCAGYTSSGMDACKGDSGGGLMCRNADDRWLLAGVVSWGDMCGNTNRPGVYTSVVSFIDWIAIKTDQNGVKNVTCDFEIHGWCGYTDISEGKYIWTRKPGDKYIQGNILYASRTSSANNNQPVNASLLTPTFNITGEGCLKFSFMFSGNSNVTLSIYGLEDSDKEMSESELLWRVTSHYPAKDSWKSTEVSLPDTYHRLIFVSLSEQGGIAGLGLDNVSLSTELCGTEYLSCTFNDGSTCNYIQHMENVQYSSAWTIAPENQMATVQGQQDLYLKAGGDFQTFGHNAISQVVSPKLSHEFTSIPHCVTFSFNKKIPSESDLELATYVNMWEELTNENIFWSSEHKGIGQWISVSTTIPHGVYHHIAFKVKRKYNTYDDIEILLDNIRVADGMCTN